MGTDGPKDKSAHGDRPSLPPLAGHPAAHGRTRPARAITPVGTDGTRLPAAPIVAQEFPMVAAFHTVVGVSHTVVAAFPTAGAAFRMEEVGVAVAAGTEAEEMEVVAKRTLNRRWPNLHNP